MINSYILVNSITIIKRIIEKKKFKIRILKKGNLMFKQTKFPHLSL